ncbi:MAG: cation transporter [Candidatus Doudnabacteria bacterium]|nr:cation transporter [Candidatus Doudnabacteria bacterium]
MNSADQQTNNKLKLSFVINTGFAFLEIFVGLFSGSLALVSDAAHNLTDSLSILIAWAGQKFAKRPATEEHTFGYGKATILTALANSIILILVAAYIIYEAYLKIVEPQPVKGGVVILVAGIGVLVNGIVALMFLKNRDNLNLRGVFLNMAFDAAVSVGAMAAGLVILLTGKTVADPIISLVIAAMLIYGSWQIIYEAVHILLEGVPENLNFKDVNAFIAAMPGVQSVHDLHIWSIASQKVALNCHIIPNVYDFKQNVSLIKQIKEQLKQKYNINHCTIEAETEICPPHEH